jgi:hypothetical protein
MQHGQLEQRASDRCTFSIRENANSPWPTSRVVFRAASGSRRDDLAAGLTARAQRLWRIPLIPSLPLARQRWDCSACAAEYEVLSWREKLHPSAADCSLEGADLASRP